MTKREIYDLEQANAGNVYLFPEGLTLITHNTKHFERIPGLNVRDWER